ncbi:tripartite tricarboxylate transporter TctB family protein [Ramlibacter tataouinensis]|uniref:tripartite tricarboxylate transporter TctB family protein n=1 Tax=Ramlibacter tataouinensis TaxID=94132 RepID=UPI0022F3C498|nr:tripartite tricarboxylate transporter TctB family protein [Ramlibacter tataouinensis]WBY00561.1 tripartite tricarboxylate transporter TctB family protein [Ramlibacter tataouinensis]
MNLVAGGFLLALAALVLAATWDLANLGNGEIGPGFFPALCGALLGVVGMALLALGLREVSAQRVIPSRAHMGTDAWRAAVITASVLLFALVLNSGGMALAVFATVWLSTRAGEVSTRTALMLSAALALVLTAIFIAGMGLHMPALPAFLR